MCLLRKRSEKDGLLGESLLNLKGSSYLEEPFCTLKKVKRAYICFFAHKLKNSRIYSVDSRINPV